MRVAMFTETYLPSTDGVVTRLLATLEQLNRLGHEVLVLAPDGGPPTYAGARVVGFPGNPFFLYPDKRVIWPRVRTLDLLRDFSPDVIHTLNPTVFGIGAILASRSMGVPLVASYHTHFPHYAKLYGFGYLSGAIWTYMRLLHNRAAVNLCTSEAARVELVRHGFASVRVWSHGVDLQRFRPLPADPAMRLRLGGGAKVPLVLLYVGRLAAEKQLERLLPLARRTDLRLAMVGDGPARQALEATFAGTSAVFTGNLHGDALIAAYTSADAFVFPSTTETLGLVLLEAMACGLPIIAAHSHPSHLLLGEDEAGMFYDGDDTSALMQAVDALAGSSELAARLRAGARARGARHGWDGPTRQLLGYYDEALGLAGAGAGTPHLASGGSGAGGR